MNALECHRCGVQLSPDASSCDACGADLGLARLVSRGTGVIPNRFVWILRPGVHSIGRAVGNTFIIPSAGVAPTAAQIEFDRSDKRFYIEPLTVKGVYVNNNDLADRRKLIEGDVIRITYEEFEFKLAPGEDGGAPGAEMAAAASDQVTSAYAVANNLQRTLAYISEFHNVPTLTQLAEKVLDAVLEVTKTRRGFFFMLSSTPDGSINLEELSARAAGGVPLSTSSYDISHSFMQRALEGQGTVIVQDAVRENAMTVTMRKHQLRAVVCVPIVVQYDQTEDVETVGIIYADNFLPTHDLPADCAASLRMFAQVASFRIQQWREEEKRRGLLQTQTEKITRITDYVSSMAEKCKKAKAGTKDKEAAGVFDEMTARFNSIQADLRDLSETTSQF